MADHPKSEPVKANEPVKPKANESNEPVKNKASEKADEKSAEQVKEEASVQAAASARSATPGPSAPPVEDSKEHEKAAKAAGEVSNQLTDLTHHELTRLRSAVDSALSRRGVEPEAAAGPTLDEVTGTLPIRDDDDGKLSSEDAAKKVDLDDDSQVIGVTVRQAKGATGNYTGPKYVRVVLADGSKRIAKL